MHKFNLITAGTALEQAKKALIMVHGRGGSAENILGLAQRLEVKDFALIAPQATNHTWYPYSFLMPPDQNEPYLSSALQLLKSITEQIVSQGIAEKELYFLGFSQGACLTLEFTARNAKQYGGIVAFTGGLIGDKIYPDNYAGNFVGTSIFIGSSDPDPHVPVRRVEESAELLQKMNARVYKKIYAHGGHLVNEDEIAIANKLVFTS
jgi:phospholipase/carboxylesterase